MVLRPTKVKSLSYFIFTFNTINLPCFTGAEGPLWLKNLRCLHPVWAGQEACTRHE